MFPDFTFRIEYLLVSFCNQLVELFAVHSEISYFLYQEKSCVSLISLLFRGICCDNTEHGLVINLVHVPVVLFLNIIMFFRHFSSVHP
jgi:hypothetical protein